MPAASDRFIGNYQRKAKIILIFASFKEAICWMCKYIQHDDMIAYADN